MISVVIPNFNGERLLKKNLPRLVNLLHKSKLEFEVIVVDDASEDESAEFLGTQEKIRLIEHRKNVGFPVTADEGIRAAKGEIVFVIKNDAVPEKADYFKLLLEHFKDNKVFAVSAGSKTVENGNVEIRGQGTILYFRGFFLHFRSKVDYEAWLKTMRSTRKLARLDASVEKEPKTMFSAWADGSSSAFKKDIYLKIGGFDPIYSPGYWEDTDLGYRAWKAGYKIDFEPNAVLLHDHEQSVFKKKYGAEKLKLINMRNQFNFLWCNADLKYIFLYILWLPYHYGIAIKNWDFAFIKAHWMSEMQSMQLFAARWRRKKLSKLTDDQVLRVFQEKNQ